MTQPTLGIALITYNAAARLAQCLTSVSFADDIVVIDGGSTDATAEIARAHGARVIVERNWPGFGPQKNRALDALSTDWVLSIDADEVVTPELAAAIRAAIAAPAADVYAVDRLSSFAASGSNTAAGIRTGFRGFSGARRRASRTTWCTNGW